MAAAIVDELLTGGYTLDVGLRADGTRWALADGEPAPRAGACARAARITRRRSGPRGLRWRTRRHRRRTALAGVGVPAARAAHRTHPARRRTRVLRLGPGSASPDPAAGRAGRFDDAPAELAAQARAILARREVRATLADLGAGRCHRALRRARHHGPRGIAPRAGRAHARNGDPSPGSCTGPESSRTSASRTRPTTSSTGSTTPRSRACVPCSTRPHPTRWNCCASSRPSPRATATLGSATTRWRTRSSIRWRVAERQRRPSCRVRALGWGPWEAGMVTASHAAHFTSLGVPLIPLAAGAQAFVAELGAADDAAQVLARRRPASVTATSSRPGRPGWSSRPAVNARTHGFLTDHARPAYRCSRWRWRWSGSPPRDASATPTARPPCPTSGF